MGDLLDTQGHVQIKHANKTHKPLTSNNTFQSPHSVLYNHLEIHKNITGMPA